MTTITADFCFVSAQTCFIEGNLKPLPNYILKFRMLTTSIGCRKKKLASSQGTPEALKKHLERKTTKTLPIPTTTTTTNPNPKPQIVETLLPLLPTKDLLQKNSISEKLGKNGKLIGDKRECHLKAYASTVVKGTHSSRLSQVQGS